MGRLSAFQSLTPSTLPCLLAFTIAMAKSFQMRLHEVENSINDVRTPGNSYGGVGRGGGL